jgi:predicted permease
MVPYIDAFAPAFGLILLGHLLKRGPFPEPAMWSGIERLVFFILLPALLAVSIGQADLGAMPLLRLLAAIVAGIAVGFALCLALRRPLALDFPAFTSLVQGGIRFNNFLGFALAAPLFGQMGLAVGAVLTGLIVPMVNTVLVALFAAGGSARPTPLSVARALATNPLVLGCVVGFALNIAGGVPPGAAPLLRALGGASVALGLMAVGAALTLGSLRARLDVQAAAWAIKLVAVPACVFGVARLLGIDPAVAALAVLFMGLPTASTSYVMARQMGGDAPLMAAITTSQHLAAIISLPILVALLR